MGARKSEATRKRMSRAQRKRRKAEGQVTYPEVKVCSRCKKAQSIEEFPWRKRKGPHSVRVTKLRDAWCKACYRERCRIYYAKQKAEGKKSSNPEAAKRYRERNRDKYLRLQRESQATRRRKAGVPVGHPRKRPRSRNSRVPSEPLKKFLQELLHREKKREIVEDNPILERRMWDVMNGNGNVELRVADEILTGLERPELLNQLYPVE